MSQQIVLIITEKSDIHSFAVNRCLQLLGIKSQLVLPQTFPGHGCFSIDYRDPVPTLRIGPFTGTPDMIRSVYKRRLPHDYIIPESTLDVDRPYIADQFKSTLRGVLTLLDDRFPVNPLASAFTLANKINQIYVALDVGFKVPRTIIGCDPDVIREFITCMGKVCVKSIESYSWQTHDNFLRALTSVITSPDDLPDDAVSLNPNIYQQYIDKRYEYRLTMFGNYHACVRIDNQSIGGLDAIDWRYSKKYLGNLTATNLPTDVISSAKRMLRRLGMRFGTFDIVESVDGDFYFLEVNESGAFLWQEHHCDGIKVLEPFARYLAAADDEFYWSSERSSESLGVTEILSDSDNFDGYDYDDPMSQETQIKYWAIEGR